MGDLNVQQIMQLAQAAACNPDNMFDSRDDMGNLRDALDPDTVIAL